MDTGLFAVEVEKRAAAGFDLSRFNQSTVHGIIGVNTEAGELLDMLKKAVYKKIEIDREKIIDEAGDVLWYLQRLLSSVNSDLDECMTKNVAKLAARFGDMQATTEAHNSIDRTKEAQAQAAVQTIKFGHDPLTGPQTYGKAKFS